MHPPRRSQLENGKGEFLHQIGDFCPIPIDEDLVPCHHVQPSATWQLYACVAPDRGIDHWIIAFHQARPQTRNDDGKSVGAMLPQIAYGMVRTGALGLYDPVVALRVKRR